MPLASSPPPDLPDAIGNRLVGAYIRGGAWQGFDSIYEVEAVIGHKFAITHWFTNWDDSWKDQPIDLVLSNKRIPLISWQSHTKPLDLIASGEYDDYIRDWAKGVGQYSELIYIRLFPEMNGDWVPWNGNPEALVEAWKRIFIIFEEENAHNVRWVWSPNITDWPRTDANKMENYYPGSEYVDVLALDGYNWGTTREWSTWRSFEDIFAEPYDRIAALGPQAIWLAEIASTDQGGNKGNWIRDMLDSRAFPRLEAIVWFSEHKEVDWRIDSSKDSLAGFQNWFDSKTLLTKTYTD